MRQLIATVLEQIDEIAAHAVGNREVLLHHYKSWPVDRLLGPPFPLGQQDQPEALADFRNQLIVLDGPARAVQRIVRSMADMDRLFADYDAGFYAARTVADWRNTVETIYGVLADALCAAEEDLSDWKRPDGSALRDKDYLFKEDIARFYDIKPESAQSGMRLGRYGPVAQIGKAHVIKKSDFTAALDAGRRSREFSSGVDINKAVDQLADRIEGPPRMRKKP